MQYCVIVARFKGEVKTSLYKVSLKETTDSCDSEPVFTTLWEFMIMKESEAAQDA